LKLAERGRVVRGVAMNWAALVFSSAVAFFLSPFVVHHLGNIAYGVWTLVISVISYIGLLDLGLRGAVTRYVSHHKSQSDHDKANQIVSGVLWFRLWISLLAILIGLIVGHYAPQLFHVPREFQRAATLAIAIAATSFGVTLLGGVFGGILAGLQRFDLLSTVAICQTLIRALGVYVLLTKGHGVVALAYWEFAVVLAANSCLIVLAYVKYPQLRVSLGRPESETFQSIWEFSAYLFIIQICVQVIYYTDNLVVGVFVSTAAVTFYSIAGTLTEYIRLIISSLVSSFLPLASRFQAEGQPKKIQRLLIRGTNVALAISLPIEVALLFRGPTFIRLWMGSQYAREGGAILQVLLVSLAFSVTNHVSSIIAYGLGRPKPMVLWRVGEAVANLGLSVVLAMQIGAVGVAWGTALPSLFNSLFFFPRFICRLVNIPVTSYLRRTWLPSGLGVAPFGVACFLTDHYWHPTTLVRFALQVLVILPVYVIGAAVFLGNDLIAFLEGQKMFPDWLHWLKRVVRNAKEDRESTELLPELGPILGEVERN
jgi:O-antigen/teichoic acid export membrane protein